MAEILQSDVRKVAARERRPSLLLLRWHRFAQNRLAVFGGVILVLLYAVCFAVPEIVAPYTIESTSRFVDAPPQAPIFIKDGQFTLQPYVHGLKKEIDKEAYRSYLATDETVWIPVNWFSAGVPYKLWGIIPMNIHLFAPANPKDPVFLFGTDKLGRDLFSRTLYGGRVSLSIGLIGALLTLFIGVIVGTISGYFGGPIDMFVQRFAELLLSFPVIPLWMALSVLIPLTWDPVLVYGAIIVLMSFIGWGGVARQIRGMTLSLRERDYATASRGFGASDWYIITRHLIPNMTSHIIVIATIAVPSLILGETALSFLGVGLHAPVTSWGILLQEAQRTVVIRYHPWTLIPVLFVFLTVLAFNLLGDGLRDAADPFSEVKE
jgi:peptide/nickel transport system permease protein